jgi:hypothetical protein
VYFRPNVTARFGNVTVVRPSFAIDAERFEHYDPCWLAFGMRPGMSS